MNLKLINNIFRFSLVVVSSCILSLSVSEGICLAESPGIRITQPQDGLTVTPGQEITVTVEAVGGFVIRGGRVGVAHFTKEKITVLPATVNVTIPQEAAGKVIILAFGYGELSKFVSNSITLNVQQTATLQFLEINQDKISIDLDWDGNIKEKSSDSIVTVYGIYSDGVKRILDDDPNTAYLSNDPAVISIDNKGNYTVHKVGTTTITVSNSGVSKIIPLVFEEPRGIRPNETIPPTTQIDIQPPANSAGWHNSDITITITAQDNEGGSGIQEVDWRFAGKAKGDYVNGDSVVVTYDLEGVKNLSYWSRDKEGNEDDNKMELRLDKTPPVTTTTVTPKPNQTSWYNSDVTVSFTAVDSLSGVKNVTPPVTVIVEGANQAVTGEAIDLADNKSTASVALNIDKTPPQLILQLKSVNLSEDHREDKDEKKKEDEGEGNWYELIYSAKDSLSGLKDLQAGIVIIPFADFKQELEVDEEFEIEINEKKKEIRIEAPYPQGVLEDLKDSLFNLDANRNLQLKIKQGESKWKIKQKPQGFEIQAPSIIFKAIASDMADNTAAKELEKAK